MGPASPCDSATVRNVANVFNVKPAAYRRSIATDPQWSAYHKMQRQIYREFLSRTAALIHQIDPQCLVSVNWAYSLRMPERPDPGMAYLTGDIGNRVEGLSARCALV